MLHRLDHWNSYGEKTEQLIKGMQWSRTPKQGFKVQTLLITNH